MYKNKISLNLSKTNQLYDLPNDLFFLKDLTTNLQIEQEIDEVFACIFLAKITYLKDGQLQSSNTQSHLVDSALSCWAFHQSFVFAFSVFCFPLYEAMRE